MMKRLLLVVITVMMLCATAEAYCHIDCWRDAMGMLHCVTYCSNW